MFVLHLWLLNKRNEISVFSLKNSFVVIKGKIVAELKIIASPQKSRIECLALLSLLKSNRHLQASLPLWFIWICHDKTESQLYVYPLSLAQSTACGLFQQPWSLFVVVGGLLSAHLLSKKAGVKVEAGWPCSGPLLRMAEDAARKLLPGEHSCWSLSFLVWFPPPLHPNNRLHATWIE